MFQLYLMDINFSQKSPHFSLLSSTSSCRFPAREVTSLCCLPLLHVGSLQEKSLLSVVFHFFMWVPCKRSHFSLLSSTSSCGFPAREVTSLCCLPLLHVGSLQEKSLLSVVFHFFMWVPCKRSHFSL
jgi:hypothetical protein